MSAENAQDGKLGCVETDIQQLDSKSVLLRLISKVYSGACESRLDGEALACSEILGFSANDSRPAAIAATAGSMGIHPTRDGIGVKEPFDTFYFDERVMVDLPLRSGRQST
jgi:hypothetical protein